MLDLINNYLRLGLEANNEASSIWSLAVAVILMATMMLDRQSKD